MKALAFLAAGLAALALSLAGCERKGPAEKAGEAIDRAGEKASRNIEKAGRDVRDAVDGKK
jgi:predicted small lipoprotein YifL